MKQNEIKLLKKQIQRLDEENFNLDIWKKSTMVIMERIFGPMSSEVKQIKEISRDMSSWTLRDNRGDENDSTRQQCQQILETCIYELELTETEAAENKQNSLINVLQNELKGSQFQEVKTILSTKSSASQKSKTLKKVFENLDKSELLQILTEALSKTNF